MRFDSVPTQLMVQPMTALYMPHGQKPIRHTCAPLSILVSFYTWAPRPDFRDLDLVSRQWSFSLSIGTRAYCAQCQPLWVSARSRNRDRISTGISTVRNSLFCVICILLSLSFSLALFSRCFVVYGLWICGSLSLSLSLSHTHSLMLQYCSNFLS